MFDFYTVEEWEEHLAITSPAALVARLEEDIKFDWKPRYILIQKNLEELKCEEWIKEHCEGVWKKYTHQYEFQLKKDALLFKLVWTK